MKRGKLRRLGGMGAFQGRRETAVDSSEALTRYRRLTSEQERLQGSAATTRRGREPTRERSSETARTPR